MPKKDIDYSKTVIYKIVCNDLNIKDCYVGSTTDFRRRKCEHKKNCNHQYTKDFNFQVYKFIRENGGWINWDMILIEPYNCTNKLEAHKRERYWIEKLNATLNKVIPTRSNQEYYQDNKDKIKQYIETNKVKFQEKRKIRDEKNKDKIKEYQLNYINENKDKIKQHKTKIVVCICGASFTHQNNYRHIKSKKHIDFIEKSNI